MSINRYRQISNTDVDFQDFNPKAYVPKLTDIDYRTGYVIRYFIQKSNDINSPIIEVDSDTFRKFSKSSFYRGKGIRWRLTGSIEDVKYSNSASISTATDVIKNLKLYLPNLLQFHK